jgi:hypothetical protein
MTETNQAERDAEHLRLLTIFHYVVAAMAALWACFPIIHLVIGIAAVMGKLGSDGKGPPELFGWFFIAMASVFMLTGWSLATCLFLAGRFLKQRRRYTFCFVVACVSACVCMPVGTGLGVCTIIVLLRPSVKELFPKAH